MKIFLHYLLSFEFIDTEEVERRRACFANNLVNMPLFTYSKESILRCLCILVGVFMILNKRDWL